MKKVPLKKKSSNSVKQAKIRAWKAFSLYIRTRDCLETTGDVTRGICITCDKRFPFSELQAGHYIQGRHGSTLFLENNCHIQCRACNIFKRGNLVPYARKMRLKYGIKVMDLLEELDKEPSHYKKVDYEELEKHFTRKLEEL